MKDESSPVATQTLLADAWSVVLAGGAGTRLWPASRQNLPKQYLKLVGNRSLIQATVQRLGHITPTDRILVVAGGDVPQLSAHLDGIEILVEPASRNTAGAIGLAALHFLTKGHDPLMIVAPSDHLIADESAFGRAVSAAAVAANGGALVTLGATASRPESGYGYIHAPGDELSARKVLSFKEKPDSETARTLLAEGGWYWNTGIFVWRASTILAEIAAHAPEIHKVLEAIQESAQTCDLSGSISRHFTACPNISIDKAILERSRNVRCVTVEMGWSDVGSWDSIAQMSPKDANGNSLLGNVVTLDTSDSLIRADHRLVAALGVRGLIIVETPDAVLVSAKDRTQDVKALVEVLRMRGAPEQADHATVPRPWGNYTVLLHGQGFKLKLIEVRAGGRLSLQSHRHRSEHWVVIAGIATVTCDGESRTVREGESTFIPVGARHRLENLSDDVLRIVEVQVGEYVGEDDIERYDDVYGRLTTSGHTV